MNPEELRKLADSFFEWPSDDRAHVTTTSAILFAQHVLRETQQVGEPLFWARVHPNGEPTRDILPNDVIEEVRKNSGAWKPLFLAAPTAQERKCWCHTCRPVTLDDMRMVLCPDCGNKRCPKANDHRNSCTESNEPGQIGSAYPAPQAQPAPTNKESANAKDSD